MGRWSQLLLTDPPKFDLIGSRKGCRTTLGGVPKCFTSAFDAKVQESWS